MPVSYHVSYHIIPMILFYSTYRTISDFKCFYSYYHDCIIIVNPAFLLPSNKLAVQYISMSVYHRIVYIPFHIIFERHCVERIILRMISLIDVCLPGTVCLVFWLIQNLLPPLNAIFELLIYLLS